MRFFGTTVHGRSIIERRTRSASAKTLIPQQDLSDCSSISRCPRSACGRSKESIATQPERPLERRPRKP